MGDMLGVLGGFINGYQRERAASTPEGRQRMIDLFAALGGMALSGAHQSAYTQIFTGPNLSGPNLSGAVGRKTEREIALEEMGLKTIDEGLEFLVESNWEKQERLRKEKK